MAIGSWLRELDRRVLGFRVPSEPISGPVKDVWESMPRDRREIARLKFETGRLAADADEGLVLADLYDQALAIQRRGLRAVAVFWLLFVVPFAVATVILTSQPSLVVTMAVGMVLIPGAFIALVRRQLRRRRDANREVAGLRT